MRSWPRWSNSERLGNWHPSLVASTIPVIDTSPDPQQTQRVTVLLVCADEQRLDRMKQSIQSAGFRTISANALDCAWARTDFFDFAAVVLDYQFTSDIAASAFRQRFITLNLLEHAAPEAVALELASLFNRVSELVQ